jgi:hypothetical protein
MSLFPDEFCHPASDKLLSCRDKRAAELGTHCEHWYEDQGCCACGTQEPNLVIIGD